MAVDDVRLDQGKPADSPGADAKDQSDLDTPSEEGTKSGKDSDLYELVVNGTTHKFNTEELVELVSKGLDYTQKTQMLADEKKRIEPYKPFITKMETNAEFAEQVIQAVSDIESQDNQSSDSGADPKMKAEMAILQKQISDLKMGTQFNALEEKYGKSGVKIDRTEIAAYAGANGITDPEVAFIMLKKDALEEAAKQEGIKIGKEGGGDKSKVIVHPGGAGIKTVPPVDLKDMSVKDRRARAVGILSKILQT